MAISHYFQKQFDTSQDFGPSVFLYGATKEKCSLNLELFLVEGKLQYFPSKLLALEEAWLRFLGRVACWGINRNVATFISLILQALWKNTYLIGGIV